jgi:hypothetical protein
LIDAEVHRIIEESHAEATRLLLEHRKSLDLLAQALLAHETLDEQEIRAVVRIAGARSGERSGAGKPNTVGKMRETVVSNGKK